MRLSQFTLSRKDPEYVARATAVKECEEQRLEKGTLESVEQELSKAGVKIKQGMAFGSFVAAKKIGDGSAREQAASCQRVLGGIANIAEEYATKRYRSNLVNWGILPLVCRKFDFEVGDYIYIENITELIKEDSPAIPAKHISGGKVKNITLEIGMLTEEEKKILLSGCLINYNAEKIK